MTFAYPRIAYKFVREGNELRAFGDCDQVERSAGFTPNLLQIRFPRHEFLNFGGEYDREGDIELYFTAGDEPDVVLKGWWIDFIEDTLLGKPITAAGANDPVIVMEKTITFSDRRCEFTDGAGGYAYWGDVNKSTPDGKGVSNPTNSNFPVDGATYFHMLLVLIADVQLTGAMTEKFVSGCPEEITPFSDRKPRDLKVDGSHIPTLMAKLLDECEAALILRNDGQYDIKLLEAGDLPTIDANKLIPTENYQPRANRPDVVVISSAPTRMICETRIDDIVLPTAGRKGWVYVGADVDGTYKPVDDLIYVTGSTGPESALNCVKKMYEPVDEQHRAKADASLFKMLQLDAESRKKCCPFLMTSPQTVEDASGTKHSVPGVRLFAKIAIKSYLDYGQWKTASDYVEITGIDVDPTQGILASHELIMQIGSTVASGWLPRDALTQLVPNNGTSQGNLYAIITHECRENQIVPTGQTVTKPWRDYFCAGFKLNSSREIEQIEDEELDTAMGAAAEKTKVISVPPLCAFRDQAGVITNLAELTAEAQKIAARALALQSVPARTYKYKGFHPVDCNGNILSVRWKLKEGITEFDYRTFFISKNRYLDKKAFSQVKANASSGASTAAAASPGVKAGTSAYAQPSQVVMGRSETSYAGPSGMFQVKVLQDGGSAGDKTTVCSFTYTVKDLSGNTLKKNAAGDNATAMPVLFRQWPAGKMAKAPDNSYGVAFYDGADLKLWSVAETKSTKAC